MLTTGRARSYARVSSFIAIGIAVLGAAAQPVRADLFDAQTITNNTGSSQTQMNLTFAGNVTGDIDATVNPFGSGGSQQIAYNSGSNTTQVVFSGPAVAVGGAAMYGLSFTNNSFDILSSYWDTLTDAFPSLSDTASSMSATGTMYYSLFFTELSFEDGTPVEDEYEELPTPGGCGEFNMAYDEGADTVSTFDSAVGGAWITSAIPLDELNQTDTPPIGPIFWRASAPADVDEGEEFEEDVYVPEPASMGMIIVSSSLLLRRRSRA